MRRNFFKIFVAGGLAGAVLSMFFKPQSKPAAQVGRIMGKTRRLIEVASSVPETAENSLNDQLNKAKRAILRRGRA
ncbi:MAG: hypothetical protein ACYCX4_00920 [Bacillota bacterium]